MSLGTYQSPLLLKKKNGSFISWQLFFFTWFEDTPRLSHVTRYQVVDLEHEFFSSRDQNQMLGWLRFCSVMPFWFPPQMACGQTPLTRHRNVLLRHHIELTFLIANDAVNLCSNPDEFILGRTLENPVWYIMFHEQHDFSISVGWDPLRWIDWFRIGVLTSLQKGTWIQGPIAIHFWKPGFFWLVLCFFGSGFC